MGRFNVKLQLANHEDKILAKAGVIPATSIRRAEVEGLVDSGATRLVLPTAVADLLGLPRVGKVTVQYADRRRAERDMAGDVDLTLFGRTCSLTASLEPDRTTALIGAIVMEELDLLIDCRNGMLRPRDPDGMINEIE